MSAPKIIEPAFGGNSVNVAFTASAAFAPMVSVALLSLIKHASANRQYDIVIITPDMGEDDKIKITSLTSGHQNISVRVYNILSVAPSIYDKIKKFSIGEHWIPALYCRLFAPSIFSEYDRIVYPDSDIVFMTDIAGLFDLDLKGHPIGAPISYIGVSLLLKHPKGRWANQLKMRDVKRYISPGAIVMDLVKMRLDMCEERLFSCLEKLKTPQIADQDIFNMVLEGDIEIIDGTWNSEGWLELQGTSYHVTPNDLPSDLYKQYIETVNLPKIIHYVGEKPWALPHNQQADIFWKYAFKTPYACELLLSGLYKLQDENEALSKSVKFYRLPWLKAMYVYHVILGKFLAMSNSERHMLVAKKIKQEYHALNKYRDGEGLTSLEQWVKDMLGA